MKKMLNEVIPYVVIILAVILFRLFIATPVRVDGDSMNPTLKNNQILLLNKMDKNYKRFDVVVFNHNGNKLVKRIIGLPGDKVTYNNDLLYINDKLIEENYTRKKTDDFISDTVPVDMYFVLGDNRSNSLDSRYIGFVLKKDIEGTVNFSIIPPKKIK
ncbi:MAG: signal peptidase I [Bacilli bacterium]|nr:signal peptidase I [Bacilli bacterium]